ncbi:autophagy protein Apg5-domain-containing protein [Durotheca rogersii]|uniref:autophagy protein Apg5-domain-containing protein n=1 Tax=Durotheca rogersii TaxID=419775 RepID=UPI0022204952|nr:autophagy protein Apg5-domain-containing protein [Durotheca rogersii]KAI5860087.1 autophagy protein Apg5-domain-containing protein [Durotheca rogersii]
MSSTAPTPTPTTTPPPPPSSSSIPQTLWDLQVPLFITYAGGSGEGGGGGEGGGKTLPFVASVPRFSYLALLLPRLSAFFGRPCSSFHHEDVLLRNLAVGLLVDLYQPRLPWRLTVSDGVSWDIGDTFLNSAKEADFVRNGNAHQIMSLSKEHTTALWNAVQDNDYAAFSKINTRLLNTSRELRNVPIRIYIPQSQPSAGSEGGGAQAGSFKVVQSLLQPRASERVPQTLGAALRGLMPRLFPSSRDPVLADIVLHGARVPFATPLEELMREAAYPDGWLCLVVQPLDV